MSASTTASLRLGAASTTRCTGPSEHTTAVIRVSRRTGQAHAARPCGGELAEAVDGLHDLIGQRPAARRLEPGSGVVGDRGALVDERLEAGIHGGRVAVGGGGVQRRVELVGGDHLGAVLAQVLGDVPGERPEPAELADDDA